jgi:hypothetical protein
MNDQNMADLDFARRAVDVLNRINMTDPTVLPVLINCRVVCNDELSDDPTVQVGRRDDGEWHVGLLGILNGIAGTLSDGWGPIVATSNDNGTIKCFEVNSIPGRKTETAREGAQGGE